MLYGGLCRKISSVVTMPCQRRLVCWNTRTPIFLDQKKEREKIWKTVSGHSQSTNKDTNTHQWAKYRSLEPPFPSSAMETSPHMQPSLCTNAPRSSIWVDSYCRLQSMSLDEMLESSPVDSMSPHPTRAPSVSRNRRSRSVRRMKRPSWCQRQYSRR